MISDGCVCKANGWATAYARMGGGGLAWSRIIQNRRLAPAHTSRLRYRYRIRDERKGRVLRSLETVPVCSAYARGEESPIARLWKPGRHMPLLFQRSLADIGRAARRHTALRRPARRHPAAGNRVVRLAPKRLTAAARTVFPCTVRAASGTAQSMPRQRSKKAVSPRHRCADDGRVRMQLRLARGSFLPMYHPFPNGIHIVMHLPLGLSKGENPKSAFVYSRVDRNRMHRIPIDCDFPI